MERIMKDSQDPAVSDDTQGMSYLNRLPRRVVTIYLPLALFVFVLLFPFYWMAITAVKPNSQLTDYQNYSPFWVVDATLDHIKYLLFETSYPGWLWNTMLVATAATIISLVTSILSAYAIERIRFTGSRSVGLLIFLAYLVPPSILFIPLAFIIFKLGIYDSRLALIFTYPTFLIPFCTWLLMGYFRSIPFELEESALVDGASRWQILVRIILPLAVPGLISAIHPVLGKQDGAGRCADGACPRGYFRMGRADGGCLVRVASGGYSLLVFRRLLRVIHDRCSEGMTDAVPVSAKAQSSLCRHERLPGRYSCCKASATARSAMARAASRERAAAINRPLWQKLAPLTPVAASSAPLLSPAQLSGKSALSSKPSSERRMPVRTQSDARGCTTNNRCSAPALRIPEHGPDPPG